MPKISRYAFILRAEGYDAKTDWSVLVTEGFNTKIVAVSSLEEACEVAKKLVNEGIELIELCGGFSLADSEVIIKVIEGRIPVGLVGFSETEEEKLITYSKQ